MPLSQWLNPWRSPYDSQVPDEVSRPARANAYFSLAAALSSSPDIVGNLSRGMMEGQQAYQGGISGYLQQQAAKQAEEEERTRKQSYLELQQQQMEQNALEHQAAMEARRQQEIERQNATHQQAERRARIEKLAQEKGIDPRILDLPDDVAEKVLAETFLTPKPTEIERVTMADGRLGYVDPKNPTQIILFGGVNPVRPYHGGAGGAGGGSGDYVDKVVTGGGEVVFVDPRTHTVTPGYKFKDFGADPESLDIQRLNFQRQTAKDMHEMWLDSLDYVTKGKLSEQQKTAQYWKFFEEAGKRTAAPASGPGHAQPQPPPPAPPPPGQSRSPVINNYRNRTRFRGASAPVGAGSRVGAGGSNVAGVQIPARPSAIPTGQGGARVATAGQSNAAPQLDAGLVSDTALTLQQEGEASARALLKANGYSEADINRYIAAARGGGR